MNFHYFLSIYIKFFFLMTPFFVLSMFLAMTQGGDSGARKKLALKVTIAIIITCTILLFFGKYIFDIFGITLDSFRIGAGALLFITSVNLIQSGPGDAGETPTCSSIAVVPLAIPITIGPGTIGAILVMGASMKKMLTIMTGFSALITASITVGAMLYWSSTIQKYMGKNGLAILSKITGLVLSALSAQLIFTGIKNFLNL